MEALILSCSTGGGHNSAGQAIAKELESRGWTTRFFDPYSLRSHKMADRVGNAYVSLIRFSPALFGRVYALGQAYVKAEHDFHLPDPVLALQKSTALALENWLLDHPVDLILCSHPFPALMLTWLKQHRRLLPPTMMIPTDYTCIPFESDIQTDWMSLPYPDLAFEFEREGIPAQMLIPAGIPVDPAFARPQSRIDAATSLGLDPQCRYILIGGGSMGTDGIWNILSQLRPILRQQSDLRALVLCGSNQALFQKIAALQQEAIQPIGFSHQMPEYLSLASLYITKPGGLSITEAAVSGIPLLLTSPIPGCETINARFFEDHGWALYARTFAELPRMVQVLLENEPKERKPYTPEFQNPAAKLADWAECAALLNPLPLALQKSRSKENTHP